MCLGLPFYIRALAMLNNVFESIEHLEDENAGFCAARCCSLDGAHWQNNLGPNAWGPSSGESHGNSPGT